MTDPSSISLPRPYEVPPEVTDEELKEVVIQFMSGARINHLAALLCITTAEFRRMMVSPRWQDLLLAQRDSVANARLGSVHNIEQQLLDHIQHLLDHGVEGMSALGERYTRKLNPKETASLANTMQGYKKEWQKTAAASPGRRTLDRATRMAELERFAASTLIDATPESATKQ